MSEPLTAEDMAKTQRIVAAVPPGPWEIPASEHGLPDQIGPVCFLETWVESERVPVLEFIQHAREALPQYLGIAARQQDRIRQLERRIRELEGGDSRG